MGNCYSAGTTEGEIEVLEMKGLPKRFQQAGNVEEEDGVQDIDIQVLDMKVAQETVVKLEAFLSNLRSSNPAIFNETIAEMRSARGEPYTYILEGTNNLTLSTLGYRSAVEIDGSLYEGQWNENLDQSEGLGVKVSSDGSIYEGMFNGGKINGRGRLLNS